MFDQCAETVFHLGKRRKKNTKMKKKLKGFLLDVFSAAVATTTLRKACEHCWLSLNSCLHSVISSPWKRQIDSLDCTVVPVSSLRPSEWITD